MPTAGGLPQSPCRASTPGSRPVRSDPPYAQARRTRQGTAPSSVGDHPLDPGKDEIPEEPAGADDGGGEVEGVRIAAGGIDDHSGDHRADDPREIADSILDSDPAPRRPRPGKDLADRIKVDRAETVG